MPDGGRLPDDPLARVTAIDFVDIGCSGSLDPRWAGLAPLLAYTGFDPDRAECDRLAGAPHPFRSARYLPYAVAGEAGAATLHRTESPRCCSLLRPKHPWLARFAYADLFRETGEETVSCVTLDALVREQGLSADILKIDSQGLELPILCAGGLLLENAFCVETETGFLENYVGETTYSQIDAFMRAKGFLMFDLDINRSARRNALAGLGKAQPLWCQAVWLRDYAAGGRTPGRLEALKALRICRALGYYDFGLELAEWFRGSSLLTGDEAAALGRPESWTGATPRTPGRPASRTGRLLRLLPDGINRRLLHGLKELLEPERRP